MTRSSCGNLKPRGPVSEKSHRRDYSLITTSVILNNAVYVRGYYSSKPRHSAAGEACQAEFPCNKNVNPKLKCDSIFETIALVVVTTVRCERLSRICSGGALAKSALRLMTKKKKRALITSHVQNYYLTNNVQRFPQVIIHKIPILSKHFAS